MSLCWSSEGGEAFKILKQPLVLQEEGNDKSAVLAAKLAEERPRQRAAVPTILTYLPQVS